MNAQSDTQTRNFLLETKAAMKQKLDKAKTDALRTEDDIRTFTAAIASIDMALKFSQ